MTFDTYRDKIEQILVKKSSNNLANEAIVELKEIDLSIKATSELTILFKEWLEKSGITEEATILGKGCIQCIVKNDKEEKK